jgi:hypothetical protein
MVMGVTSDGQEVLAAREVIATGLMLGLSVMTGRVSSSMGGCGVGGVKSVGGEVDTLSVLLSLSSQSSYSLPLVRILNASIDLLDSLDTVREHVLEVGG